ncbi:exosome complex RNA-binding protein Rrp4 [mine drainage metagenome]|uniref:Exosome complex RNA-binding protein Rrp4 n=1 Tax=mine drainage metagenome TaxID=410659 RepID=T1CX46_9ZZZZ
MVNLIKEHTGTRIVIGQNGLIWIDGTLESILKATAAIKKIEREAHTTGLTDRMTEYLKEDAADGN